MRDYCIECGPLELPPHLPVSPSPPPPSEGSVIAYYWSEFSIPPHLAEEVDRAMAVERVVTLPPRARALKSFVLTSVVAFRECGADQGGNVWASL